MALIRSGDKLLFSHRRLFENDQARYFVGVVDEFEQDIAVVTGRTFVWDAMHGRFLRKPDKRTKLLSLSSGTLICYRLPEATRIDELRIEDRDEHRLVLTDGDSFGMDMSDRMG